MTHPQPAFDASFEQARRARPRLYLERAYSFGGLPVAFRFVGPNAASYLTRALGHLEVPARPGPGVPMLQITGWDVTETGIPCTSGSLSEMPSTREVTSGFGSDRYVTVKRSQSLATLDRHSGHVAVCTAFGKSRPLIHEIAKPLQQLLSVWYYDRDIPLMHVGMVSKQGDGVLVGGAGGAGKSTTSIACSLAGFDFLGDDRIGLQETNAGFIGHSVFSSTMVFEDHLGRFDGLKHQALRPLYPDDRKPAIFLNEVLPERIAKSARIRAVVLPRFVAGRRESGIHPVPKARALLAIAPNSLILPLGPGKRGMGRLARILESVPCFRLEMGEDIRGIPACIVQILDGLEIRLA